MFCVEWLVGILAGSVALQADALDMLGDTLVYGFSLYAIHRDDRWRAGSAFLKGSIMVVLGLGVWLQSDYKLVAGAIPESHLVGGMGRLALVANASCPLLLTRHRADDLKFKVRGRELIGRQSQTPVRFPDLGWKVISAYVSTTDGQGLWSCSA